MVMQKEDLRPHQLHYEVRMLAKNP
jgi:hypothetical protein